MGHDNLTLYDIETGLQEMVARIEEAESDEQRAMYEAALAGYVAEEVRKVDNIRGYLQHAKMMAAAAKEEARIQAARGQVWENRRERLMKYCVAVLDAAGIKKVEGRTGWLSVAGNGGVTPLQIDQALVPDEYKTVTVTIPATAYEALAVPGIVVHSRDVDTTAIRAKLRTLAEGETIDGVVELERGKHLRIG